MPNFGASGVPEPLSEKAAIVFQTYLAEILGYAVIAALIWFGIDQWESNSSLSIRLGGVAILVAGMVYGIRRFRGAIIKLLAKTSDNTPVESHST